MQKLLALLAVVDGKKSYIVAGATAIYAIFVVGWGTGDWHQAILLLLGSGGLGSFRSALAKLQKVLQLAMAILPTGSGLPAGGSST